MHKLIRRLKNVFHLFEAILANYYYGFPSQKLKVIGVTGTDGKTTTASLTYHILKENNKKVSIISTVKTVVGNKEADIGLHTTTPSSFLIQKLLKNSAINGEEYFILETTSHALDQNRVYGVNYEISALTNITPEHLDYHLSFSHYLMTKAKLFLNSKLSIINVDDESYEKIKKILDENQKKYYSYGLKNKADYDLNINKKLNLTKLEDFNNYNFLAAFAITNILGLKKEQILSAIKTFKFPKGRMNVVYDKEFKIIIDFAHTPNAIKQVLKSVKEKHIKENGKIIHVFGAPGLRDKEKRPIMGKNSVKYSDIIILTSDDYRTEDPVQICEEIKAGAFHEPYLQKILTIIDRKEAIEKAISIAKKNDVVVITGIGHQQSLAQGNKEIKWDEEEVVKESIKKLNRISP